ncbi:hypothetical protein EYF80_056026 [Liparis tanakae]|uniref:Uncharacterized protein n=1 Tax=Liparis tanakae TaxID=230148 RepID=A0A4Z2EZY7_9TELE|nr:hypothetical protein EYF80_056026 [Liparis tanakae]
MSLWLPVPLAALSCVHVGVKRSLRRGSSPPPINVFLGAEAGDPMSTAALSILIDENTTRNTQKHHDDDYATRSESGRSCSCGRVYAEQMAHCARLERGGRRTRRPLDTHNNNNNNNNNNDENGLLGDNHGAARRPSADL